MPLEMYLKLAACVLCCTFYGIGWSSMFEISKDQLEYLVEHELKTPDIAEALGVSVSTIKRRLREFNISIRGTLTEMSDDDLDSVVRSIHTEFPNAGYSVKWG